MKSNLNILFGIRKALVDKLWNGYLNDIPHAKAIFDFLSRENKNIALDHFAIIDLPSRNTGIPILSQIFSSLGFVIEGLDYLPDKQNDFLWMVEEGAQEKLVHDVLPQVVLADFRLDELPFSIRKIIEKYTGQIPACPLSHSDIENNIGKLQQGDESAGKLLLSFLVSYFNTRDWEVPSLADFRTVQEANELLAWVLLFGRKVNHFTISVHLLENYKDLQDFHNKLPETLNCNLNKLNNIGSVFKGSPQLGIMQSSTLGELKEIQLADGTAFIRDSFMEFIWRYPKNIMLQDSLKDSINDSPQNASNNATPPKLWRDFHAGFIAQNANQVVESLYK